MAYFRVKYDPKNVNFPYELYINFGKHKVTEASAIAIDFHGCLDFFLRQYHKEKPAPISEAMDLSVEDKLPDQQRKILEGIVQIHNKLISKK